MDQESKKISFGFTKSTKKNFLFEKPPERNKKIQLIDCLESQKIKIKDAREEVKRPLIIPMISSVNLLDKHREIKNTPKKEVEETPDSELTVEQLAARELLREAQNVKIENPSKLFVLPAVTENLIEIEGKAEPTLNDYETVPISAYGMAMLRGMGWTEGMGIGKNNKSIKVIEPALRPKGMGLGASTGNKKEQMKLAVDKDGKELILKKGSYAKIVDGKKKGCYCEVQGFDEEGGRVIVKTSLDGLVLNLNEFFLVPVTKDEFIKSSKVINIQKYAEYKNNENGVKTEVTSKSGDNFKNTKRHTQRERTSSNSSMEGRFQDRHSDDDRVKKHSKHRSESPRNYDRSDKYKSKKKSKKYRSSSSSSDEDEYERKKVKEHRKRDKYNQKRDLESKHSHRKEKHRHSKSSHSSKKR